MMRTFLPEILRLSGIFFLLDSTKITNFDSIYKLTRKRHWNTHKRFGGNALHITDIFGNTIAYIPLMEGRGADITQWHNCYYFTHGYLLWDNDETGYGDSAYVGRSNSSLYSKFLAHTFSPAEMQNMRPEDELRALRYNNALNILRASVELNIGGAKQSAMYGDRSKQRVSLHTNPDAISVYNSLATYLHGVKMVMRGQKHASNPEVLSHGMEGINPARRIINEKTNNLFTAMGYSKAYYGIGITGRNVVPPPPRPMR
jgi:hypothetical protein